MDIEFTFVLPCLNEEKTLPFVIEEIQRYIDKSKISAEILVSDNDSTDNSVEVAKKYGCNVSICKTKGYGAALINGTNNAKGKYCIMGDCDGSYNFSDLDAFVKGVRDGYDLVVGNRYKGGIEKGAMSLSHIIGVKLLSSFTNMLFHTPVKDFHCGLRAYNKEKIKQINLIQTGMEYASEMIIKAKINNLKILEVPTNLRKDLRDKKSHLRTIRDGFRHLFLVISLFFENIYSLFKREKTD